MKITNEVLLEKITNIHEDIGDIKNHLDKLNGQTLLNSEHRIQQKNTNKLIYGSMVIVVAVAAVIVKFF